MINGIISLKKQEITENSWS